MPEHFLHQVASQMLPVVCLVAVISMAAVAFFYRYLPSLKGRAGEFAVHRALRKALPEPEYLIIPDVVLPVDGATTQIDHVVVSRYGIFVIETKNYAGWIFGAGNESQWTQTIYRKKSRFQNPLRQNYRHTKTLSELTGIPHEYFKSLVVFVGNATFKTLVPPNVIRGPELTRTIRAYNQAIIQDEQVPEIAAAIREWAATVDEVAKVNHVRNLRRRHGNG
jgi:restriction system protein